MSPRRWLSNVQPVLALLVLYGHVSCEVFCERPTPVENGKIPEVTDTDRTSFPYGSDIHYVCDKGYRMEGTGDAWRTCIETGVWSGRDPICKAVLCPDPETPENGVRLSPHYPVGSRIRFSCNADYELKGAEEIFCQANGEWAGELTKCDPPAYPQCGRGKENVGVASGRIVGGQHVTEPWPWMAALYMKESEEDTEKTLMCGGSLIHPHFVLTAGHCMYYSGDILREPSDITVKLGLVKVSDAEHMRQSGVRKVHVHRSYSRQTLDYDAALLELEEPVHYNSRLWPICLPHKDIPSESPLFKAHSEVWTAGWGHEKRRPLLDETPVKQSDVLKEVQLDIQPRETCRESLEGDDRTFTDRMFCAGKRGALRDTCKGDSGGPVMQRHLDETGQAGWTQVGIVSWGLGCGQKTEYGMYAHLQPLMPWIDDTVREAKEWNR